MNNPKKPILILSGATATGKTSTSIKLASSFKNIEILNFDSLLFYKELHIGTAKPSASERAIAPHHLVDVVSIDQEMNASKFCEEALKAIDSIHCRLKVPLLVGGSAFYIRALIKGMYEAPKISIDSKNQVELILKERGPKGLREELEKVDKPSFDSIHENDLYRSSRALEYFFSTSLRFSEQKVKFDGHDPYDFSQTIHDDWSILHLYMSIEKTDHWAIMLKRTEQMIQDGLIEEVEKLINNTSNRLLKPLQSIGYKETIEFLDSQNGTSPMTKKELIEKIYISTRQLAKSQKTFFNKIVPKNSFNPVEEEKKILNTCENFLSQF